VTAARKKAARRKPTGKKPSKKQIREELHEAKRQQEADARALRKALWPRLKSRMARNEVLDFDLPKCPWKRGDPPNDTILDLYLSIVAAGYSPTRIHREDPAYPDPRKWYYWLETVDGLRKRYEEAQEAGVHALAELLDLVSRGAHRKTDDNVIVQRDRLHSEMLRWRISRLAPKLYGDRVDLGVTDDTKDSWAG
jgi:hypothetical protein